jgi:hypothetical protein
MAKSEIRTIDVQHEPENRVCQRTNSCETDFAISITFGEVERTGTPTPEMEKLSLRNDTVFPPILSTGKWGKASKPPYFTKCGQEPNGMKLSSNTLPYQSFACLSAGSGSLHARLG